MEGFARFQLQSHLMEAIEKLGFTTLTPIQDAVIPLMAAGHDVIAQAQTGTGKTAAFALPILNSLEPGNRDIQALVLTPTRELAIQVARAFSSYSGKQECSVCAVYGGQSYDIQIRKLRQGASVVVGTPGRLIDLMDRGLLEFRSVRTVILDEADEMLSMGFIDDIKKILEKTPATRQTGLFSATLSPVVRTLAAHYLREPQSITIKTPQLTVDTVEQRYYLIDESDKLNALTRLFEMEDMTRAIIFARTRLGTAELTNSLNNRGFPVEALSGDLSQSTREQILNRFRQNQTPVIVATDVAARGLDIDDISHVINYDLPEDPELYVHRIGRTARAGKRGVAITLITPRELWRLKRIEHFSRQTIARHALPTVEEILARRDSQLLTNLEVWLKRGRCARERDIAMKLLESGNEPLAIITAALKLARTLDNQRPIAALHDIEEIQSVSRPSAGRKRTSYTTQGKKQFSHEKGMVRLVLSAGKLQGIRPNDVVGTIAARAAIPGSTIGHIRIQESCTFVDIPTKYVDQTLSQAGKYHIRKVAVTLERA